MPLLGPLLGLLVGLALGTLGGGGSTLTVPIFLYVYGHDVKQAIAMGLGVVGVTSLAGALMHARGGTLRIRSALLFGPVSMAATFLGARLGLRVDDRLQLGLFATLMIVSAGLMLRPPRQAMAGHPRREPRPALVVVTGAGVGLMTGLLGMGGGFLIVPALVLLLGLPMSEAVGTSLVVIVLNAAAGILGYLGHVPFDWHGLATFTLAALAGVIVGSRLVPHIPQARLRRAFAVFLLLLAALIIVERLPRITRPLSQAELK